MVTDIAKAAAAVEASMLDDERQAARARADALSYAEKQAAALIAAGWYQVSRRFRHLARLPEGKTGVEALIDARLASIGGVRPDFWPGEVRRWAESLGEASAADHFMRVYARYTPGLTCTVDADTFEAFRRLGGGCRR